MPARILIVEDERITAEDLQDVLVELGYEVTGIASSGEEALAEVERSRPDLALLDIRIQGEMDGTEVARIFAERYGIPVVYLTAHADRETLQRAKRAKPLGYLVKPFQDSELQASLEIALHRHQQDAKARDRQQHLTDVLSALIMGVISVDNSQLVMLFNPTSEHLTGFQKDEAVGNPIQKVFRLADIRSGDQVDLPIAEVLSEHRLVGLQDSLLIAKDGYARTIEGNISPLLNGEGSSIGAVIVFEETTARASAEAVLQTRLNAEGGGSEIQFGRFQILAESEEMRKVLTFALRVARSEATSILIEGESGTGKDLLAQFMHYSSARRTGPFVPVNCSAIPEHMMESELFGHVRGAFGDATRDKKGLFEVADGGTLFLDEVNELSPVMQAKLLRVLEDQAFRRLGSTDEVGVDIRVIVSSNSVLAQQVEAGDFRLDLFHRLSVIPIVIPALRERPSDILPLARHFIQQHNLKYRSRVEGMIEDSERMLLEHNWPGNIRELRNVIERAVLVEESRQIRPRSIHFVTLAPPIPIEENGEGSKWSLRQTEETLVLRALEKTGGNQSKAARLLGITRDMLRYRMKRIRQEHGEAVRKD